jgi:hypothetical protein
VLACSEGELEQARRISPRVVLVNNAIDVAALDSAVASLPARADGPLRVVTCARLSAQHIPDFFAQVAARLCRRGKPIEIEWVGGGGTYPALAAAGVRVTGWLPRTEALARLARADVYLHTSLWEGMPLAILEAMALRKPVVATDAIGNRDAVVHQQTGFLGRGVEEIAGYVEQCRDADLRQRMGQAGRQRLEAEFSLPRLLRQLSQLYRGEMAQAAASAAR